MSRKADDIPKHLSWLEPYSLFIDAERFHDCIGPYAIETNRDGNIFDSVVMCYSRQPLFVFRSEQQQGVHAVFCLMVKKFRALVHIEGAP